MDQFQKVVDSLFLKDNVDIYITGSNAQMLSGEISTLLSGRYVEIEMLPLSFKEYVSTKTDQMDINNDGQIIPMDFKALDYFILIHKKLKIIKFSRIQ